MTDEFKKLNEEFDEIKKYARDMKQLPDKLERSTACLAAYHTLRGIYLEQHYRTQGREELISRGQAARKLFIELRRSEHRIREREWALQDAFQRAGNAAAKIIKWEEGGADALLDALQDYIQAMSGEDSPVTAGAICKALRRYIV